MSENRNKAFLKEKGKFWTTWLSILGCHGNVDVDVHVTMSVNVSR